MAIDVLGATRVEGAALHPRELAVIAALVVRSGRPLSTQDLAEIVWPESERPATWNKQIHASIARVRRAVGPRRIVTTASGYHLDIDPDEVDARLFESLVSRARKQHTMGEPDRAVATYRRALDLWRGRPYEELVAWPEAMAAAIDLENLQIEASEEILHARLDAGDSVGVISEAESLLRDEPLRESRWALLALASYRAGRQADALSVLRSARERLAEELGIDPGPAIGDLESAILRHDKRLETEPGALPARADCPYRGLAAYQPADADDFFGREAEIAAAVRRLDAAGFLVVTGASGSGKSSLARAGVVPSLRRRGRRVLVVAPGSALAEALRDVNDSGRQVDTVVVDQFEEVLEAGDGSGAQVSALLARFAGSGGQVVLTVRSDFLDRCAADRALGPLMTESVMVVSPMTDPDLRRVIEEPALRAGLRLEPGLVELMMRDAAGAPGVLPHLSHALAETWVHREGPVLTVAGYKATGGIDGAIAQTAERFYATLDPTDRELCRSTLLRLVTVSPDGLAIRRRLSAHPLRDDPALGQLFDQLIRARLVTIEGDSAVLVHEAVTSAWDRFRTWLEDSAEDLGILAHIEAGAAAWDAGGRADDDLARGVRLHAMLDLRERSDPALAETEAAFIDASAAHEADESRMLAAAAAAERHRNRRLRLLVVAVAVIAVIALVTGAVAIRSAMAEAEAAESARIGEVIRTSSALRDTDSVVAALLAAESYRRWPDDARTLGAMLAVLMSPAGEVSNAYIPRTQRLMGAAMIPGTETALVIRDDIHAEIRNVATGDLVRRLDVELRQSSRARQPLVHVSADGRIATVSVSVVRPQADDPPAPEDIGSWLSIIDLRSGELLGQPRLLDREIESFALSPDGLHAAYVHQSGTLVLVDTLGGSVRELTALAGTEPVSWDRGAVGFTADSRTMVVGTGTGALVHVDVESGEASRRVSIPQQTANSRVLPLADGSVIASGDAGTVSISSTGETQWYKEAATPRECGYLALSPSTGTMFCGDPDGHVVERRIDTGELTGRALTYQAGASGEMWVDTDGSRVVMMTAGGYSIGTWHLAGAVGSSPLIVSGLGLARAPSPTGRYLLAGERPVDLTGDGPSTVDSQTFTVWDMEAGRATYEVFGLDANWAGAGVLRTVSPEREVHYVDLESQTVTPAPEHDRDLYAGTEWWAQFATNATGEVLFEMRAGLPIVRQLDPTTGEPIGPDLDTGGPASQAVSVASTADGAQVVTGNFRDEGPQLTVFDASTGEVLAQRTGPNSVIATITSDQEIIAGGYDRIVRLDMDLDQVGALPTPPSGRISTLQSSHDGRTLLVTTWSNDIALYDLESSTLLGIPVSAPATAGLAAALAADGTALFVSTERGIVRWSLAGEDLLAQVCRVAGRNLSAEEWHTYLAGIGERRETCGFATE
ncbi:BTAD domain-containing putative transcriptional regulator [Microbacterium thalassium]|uniref:DNA-binding SARP family transcriptional activator/WD40 repeat protein n=1 Tax=Microbacterium thalassium TaxID=362649 RepID=A0A7X0FRK8_9MICO|nr:BTAD domain-containing putative transcriptional regulator [Microbacterium thalassium]MBB6391837.1 DNA-binding SARP family transcriptional activator/WD40 repeat protein [Microbacterium thalassium]GLK23856.1 hypothetical protein GCM10017607_11740 [Microbacterium thalassium]